MRRRGVTLLEAVLAMVLLCGATLSTLTMFHLGLHHQTQSAARMEALSIAEQRMEECRNRALSDSGFASLTDYTGSYAPDPDRAGYQVATLAEWHELHSSCSAYDDDPAQQRLMTQSAMRLSTCVKWNDNEPPVHLTTLVTEPRKQFQGIVFDDIPASLAVDEDVRVGARLLDTRGNVIPDVKFTFYIKPRTSNATLRRNRDGQHLRIANYVYDRDESGVTGVVHPGGDLKIWAQARYFGQAVDENSTAIHLDS